MNARHLRLVKRSVMRPVASAGRKANDAYRVPEDLTELEIDKLLKALKTNRHGPQSRLRDECRHQAIPFAPPAHAVITRPLLPRRSGDVERGLV